MTTATAAPSTSANTEVATIYVALELSKATWVVAVQRPGGERISRYTLPGGDSEALLDQLERVRAEVAHAHDASVQVISCYEAGHDGFWLHRVLRRNGVANHVMDASSLPVSQKHKRAKTDKIDVKTILRTLKAWHRGDPQACSMVHVPTPEQEDARRVMREYTRLKKERAQHLNRIQGVLMTQGIRTFRPLRRDWREQLEALRTADGRPLPPCLKAEMHRECVRLHEIQEMLKTLMREDRARRRAAHETARNKPEAQKTALEVRAERIEHLTALRGVGAVTASVLVDEVFYRDFRNRKEVAGYVGLAAQPYRSGSMNVDQGIDRAGNQRARWVVLELAWRWLFHQPTSRLSRWFHERVGEARGRQRRIKIVALARKLLVALWRYVTQGVVPEDAAVMV